MSVYKKVGPRRVSDPSGGGFAEYIRVMDWVVRKGVVKIPGNVSFEQASFIEPVNTCLKGIQSLRLQPGETVLVIGQGPIDSFGGSGCPRRCQSDISDLYSQRLTIATTFGISESIDAASSDVVSHTEELTEGRVQMQSWSLLGQCLNRPAMDAVAAGCR